MTRRRAYVLGGLAVLAAMLLRMPGAVVAGMVENSCAGLCRLAGAEGSWRDGNAILYLRSEADSPWLAAGKLRWQLGWGRLRIFLGGGSLAVVPGKGGLKLEATDLSLPAALLLSRVSGLPKAGWRGELEVATASAEWSWTGSWRASGILRWLGAESTLAPGLRLGDYRLKFEGDADGPLQFTLDTERGAMALTGSGVLLGSGEERFDLEARPSPEARAQAEPLLRSLGQPVDPAAGSYRVRWPGA